MLVKDAWGEEDVVNDGGTWMWAPRSEFHRILHAVVDRYDRARAFAALTRINALYMVARAGSGHIGSSFSAADIVTWLLLEEMYAPGAADGDVYFSSKGHDVPGLYAALVGLGQLDEDLLHQLRLLGGLPGHPDVGTPHMPFNTGSLGMGISKAKGLVLANRLRGMRRRVFVLTGDGELQEGQIWESLPSAVRYRMHELTVIVDHNKLQSDTWVRDVSDLGDLEARFTACGWGVLRCDGNDVTQLEAGFRRRTSDYPESPVAIIADTVKGAGAARFEASRMAESEWRYRFHSGAPDQVDHDAAFAELRARVDGILRARGVAELACRSVPAARRPAATGPRLPEVYGRVLTDRAAHDPRIIALDADLVLDTGLIPFRDTHPDRFVECGIAEQDMVSTAGGLAAGGFLPFVHSFSSFLHARPNEQIYNNATENRQVVYVGSLAGLLPAAPGHSHQAVRDVSAVGAVPGLLVLAPASPAETELAVDFCRHSSQSVYLRLSSASCPPEVADLPSASLEPGRGHQVRAGDSDVVVVGAGPVVLTQLLRAVENLHRDGIHPAIVNLPWLNRVDPDWLRPLAERAELMFVVEDHYTWGGQADVIARALAELRLAAPPRFHGIGLTQVPVCGDQDEVLAFHKLRHDELAQTIRTAVRDALPVAATAATTVSSVHSE
ncbi:transketolase C-terminal domain-containing protein [Micromonospora sp. NPDC051227]|uniref:transketolase C-terminal domain-containing protein n=1 Tax=Micromonospora sp. NPDC051227 TaxID=3364285 RepID=UPI00378E5950